MSPGRVCGENALIPMNRGDAGGRPDYGGPVAIGQSPGKVEGMTVRATTRNYREKMVDRGRIEPESGVKSGALRVSVAECAGGHTSTPLRGGRWPAGAGVDGCRSDEAELASTGSAAARSAEWRSGTPEAGRGA